MKIFFNALNSFKLLNFFLIILVVLLSISFVLIPRANAASTFVKYYVFLDKIETSQATGSTICAQPGTSSATSIDVKVAWPAGFTVSGTTGNWAASTANLPVVGGTTATAWPGITGATVSVSGQTVTYTYGSNQTLNTGTLYCFRVTNTSSLKNNSSTGTYTGTIVTDQSGPSQVDNGTFGFALVSGTTDTIGVTATVASTFTYSLGANSIALGTLPISGTPATGNTTLTISTNAANGWTAWIKSANGGLHSTNQNTTLPSAGTVDGSPTNISGAEGYQLNTVSGTGSPTIDAEYLSASTTITGGTLATSFNRLAYMTGPTSSAVVTLNLLAEASATRSPATDYADTLTISATGSF